jgi:hypothetical protein
MPGAQSCKCSCEVTFSQPKHSFVIMVATPFWIFPDHPSVAPHLHSLIVVHPSPSFDSTFWRKNDTEQHSFVPAYLPGSADMRTTIRRDHIVDLVIGNRRPFAIHFDFVMIADHAALRRATVHEVTAGAFAVVSVEL